MRRLYLVLIGFLCGLAMLGPNRAAAQEMNLRISLQQPITSHLGVNLTQFKTLLEKRSKGRIVVEIHDNSRLYSDEQVVAAVASGAIEMASITTQRFTRKVPALGILEQPFLFNTQALVRAVASSDSEIRKLLDRAVLEATGVRILWWQSYGSTVVLSKGGLNVRKPEAIRGKKVWVPGDFMGTFTQYCGGAPVLTSASKQYQAAQDGTADMVMTGITDVKSRKLWEVTDTVTRTEHAPLEFLVVMNDKAWQSLSAADRSTITQAAREVEGTLRDHMAEIEAKAYAFAEGKGLKVHRLEPNDVYEWRACGADLLADFLVEGGELANRLMAAYGRLRMQPCCNAGPAGVFSKR